MNETFTLKYNITTGSGILQVRTSNTAQRFIFKKKHHY